MRPIELRDSVERTVVDRFVVLGSFAPAGELAGTVITWPSDPDISISTAETLCRGLVKPEVSSIVPAPGAEVSEGDLPALCWARTRNHVTANKAV